MQKEENRDLSEKSVKDSFGKLNEADRLLLYMAPALVSVLAATTNNRINKKQKADAFKLISLKTYTARPELIFYFKTVEKNFRKDFEELEKRYYPFDEPKREMLRNELDKVNVVISKLDKAVAEILHRSLSEYATHIKRSGIGILDDFVFPLPIKGITY